MKNNAYIKLHLSILLAGGTGLFGRLISIGEVPLVCLRVLMAAVILALMEAFRTEEADRLVLHVHGKMSRKEYAEDYGVRSDTCRTLGVLLW